MTHFTLHDFEYDLPPDLIAKYPLSTRSASRLLCLNKETGAVDHRNFHDLISLLRPNDLLIGNNTRVIPARLWGQKATGGQIEVLVERVLDDFTISAQVRASKSPKPGSILFIGFSVEVIRRENELFILRASVPILPLIEAYGEVPIPPYFQRKPDENDLERYQTVYALHKGSVAAPTAGLHFDEEILKKIKEKNIAIEYLTLHVGAGTFAPVRVQNIAEHRMHKEYIEVTDALVQKIQDTQQKNGRIIAIGTTTVRSLETASLSGQLQPFKGETDIFIYPGFQFRCVDALITNFHLPASTLLMLVSAFGGYKNIKNAYATAVQEKYRFYSYGDAMWIA
ncbi:MAG TPA: tRNA preQ1(34) S-adenosylmethionine ribosyltransferase-isomerase QueA [Gammaproteobacteria bacterium]|nr:tRNA preQ1(34) S-adenosylmethionine ribosyltransferase-isomerase QueA [Gammaproteobacteria bacterium]